MEVCNHVPKNLLPLATTKQRPIPFGLGSGLNRKSTSGRKKDDNGSHKRNGFIALPVNGPQENGQVLNGRSCENQDSTPGQDLCDHAFNGIDENCSNFAELEVKLCDLAVELEANTTDNAKLSARVLELKQQASCLAEELQKVLQERKEQEEKHMEQRAAVRQQLEVQIQTISVLVAEKHDLLTSLKHTQRAAEQKACEAQDLASRLHASRRHVVELEQSLATAASYHRHFEHLSMQLQKEKEECKIESNRLKKDREDLKQQTSELSERLKSKQQEAEIAQAQLFDVQRKLELSELNIQQLSSHLGAADSTSQLQIAQEQVLNLELRLEQAEEATRQLGVERDWLMQQLQESSTNWQEHARHTTQQMTELVHEKDVSIARVEELKFSLAELQEQIVDLQTQQKMAAAEALVEQEMSVEKSLQEQLKTTEAERDELLALYKLQDAQLSEFKSDLEIYREQTHDQKVLLEDKQSDKATISKALSQNKQLKQEVEDLQFALAAVSSDNRETRSALQVEQHGRQKVETELEDLRKWFESLTRKLVDKSSTMNVDSSQHVLESSVTQLLYQRDQLARQCQMQNEVVDLLRIESGRDRQENYQLRDSLFVLNSEMGKWKEKSEALQKQVDLISQEQQQLRKTAGNDDGTQGLRLLQDEAHCHNHNDLQTAMDKLQEKFLTVMQDKVELMDSKELLEYNYTELSKKTKTLGEYVTFYMRHCETLSQRHEEQRNSVRRLQKDNAILTGKVNELRSFADPLSANESDSSVHCSTTKHTNEVMWL